MQRYQTPDPTDTIAFPKPVRRMRNAKLLNKWRKQPAADHDCWENTPKNNEKKTSHDDVLFACIEVMQLAYPEYSFLHVPDVLYNLIAVNGDLTWVLERSLGHKRAVELKKSLGDAFKGMLDLAIWTPELSNGLKLSMVGEIKVGTDIIKKGQRRWNRNEPVRTWSNVEDFKADMINLEKKYHEFK